MDSSPLAIVVGTGTGGLACAAHLARDGFDVLALERSVDFGGSLAPLEREGFTFDPGLHAVGECRPGQFTHRFFAELDLETDGLFEELDPDGYDRFRFPDREVRMKAGAQRCRAHLEELFPASREGLRRFFGLLEPARTLQRMREGWELRQPTLRQRIDLLGRLGLDRWLRSTFDQLLDWVTDDPELQAVLAGMSGRWGLPPSRTAALTALRVFAHFADGAFYPRGGGRGLCDILRAYARGHGARFWNNTEVTDIYVEDGRAAGVRTAEGEFLWADLVVADVDPTHLFGELIAPEHLPHNLVRKVRATDPSLAPLQLFLGLEGNAQTLGLPPANTWLHPSLDLEASFRPVLRGQPSDEHLMLVTSGTAKSPEGRLAPAGCSTLQMTTFAPFEVFERRRREAGDDRYAYKMFRSMIADQLLAELEARLPLENAEIRTSVLTTPLSHARWTNAPAGAMFGPAQTPARSSIFRFGTNPPVENVFLVGAGALGSGLAAELRSGRLAARLARRATDRSPLITSVDRQLSGDSHRPKPDVPPPPPPPKVPPAQRVQPPPLPPEAR